MKHKINMSSKVIQRRKNVIVRLEEQLKDGKKYNKSIAYPLTEKDIKRINSEIETLKSRTY